MAGSTTSGRPASLLCSLQTQDTMVITMSCFLTRSGHFDARIARIAASLLAVAWPVNYPVRISRRAGPARMAISLGFFPRVQAVFTTVSDLYPPRFSQSYCCATGAYQTGPGSFVCKQGSPALLSGCFSNDCRRGSAAAWAFLQILDRARLFITKKGKGKGV